MTQETIYKSIIFGVYITGETQTHAVAKAIESVPDLVLKQVSISGEKEIHAWGFIGRDHPHHKPFVEGVLSEIRNALTGAGFKVTVCDSDVTDEDLETIHAGK